MNTVRSFWLGWGSVCVAGAGAYYFAKREINANRHAKLDTQRRAKEAARSMEYSEFISNPDDASAAKKNNSPLKADGAGSPGQTASPDAAQVNHGPAREIGKYESAKPYRSPKGDRL